MSTINSMDVHRVVGITVEQVHFSDFVSHRITLEIEGGHSVEISALSSVGALPVQMLPSRSAHTEPEAA